MSNNNKKSAAILGGASALAVALSPASAYAAAGERLISEAGPVRAANLPAHVTKSRSVKINRRSLTAPSFELDLFGEKTTAHRDRIERHKAGQLVWVGHLGGAEDDKVFITAHGNTIAGLIYRNGEAFEITSDRRGGLVLNAVDLSSFPTIEADFVSANGASDGAAESNEGTTANSGVQQDLLVAYTPAACVDAGGATDTACAQIEARIATAVAQMNSAYAASGVDIFSNLVGSYKTTQDESGQSGSEMLTAVRNPSDGLWDDVPVQRNALGADIVALVVDAAPGLCGIGYVGPSDAYMYSVTVQACLTNRTLAHEIGHNQGLNHARSQYSSPSGYDYGYRRCSSTSSVDASEAPLFSTIMAYSCSGASRINHFSNPDVNYNGVPSGIDFDVDPDNAADAARELNRTAASIAGYRGSAPVAPPPAPSGLSANATGPGGIAVTWADNSDNEGSFTLQRSTDNAAWSTIATLGANTTSFADNGLDADTTYFYRVRAANSAGASGFSNTGSATTDPMPSSIDDVATADIAGAGLVSGAFSATHADGGAVQTITETSSGGPKRNRHQSFTHSWSFNVFGGAGGVLLTTNAWVSGGEGANFFYSSDNGATWNLMFTVDETSTATTKTFALPGNTKGPLRVQARDATQSAGEPADTLSVDYIVITSNTEVGAPPAAPSNLSINGATASSVTLAFDDNSDDEFGFEVWRANFNPQGNCNAGAAIDVASANAGQGRVSFTDQSATAASLYWYWAKAFNGAGENGQCSNSAQAITPAGPAISANANAYKVRGKHTVDLTWDGASGASVDVRRNGQVITTTANDGAHTDNIGAKGGGAYAYEVCEAGSTTVCSATLNVTF